MPSRLQGTPDDGGHWGIVLAEGGRGCCDVTPLSLFRTLDRHGRLTERRLIRQRVLDMVKRRARQAGLPPDKTCCHTARATGITAFLLEGGTVEAAQRIAAHESPRTTSLYDRTGDSISLEEIERVRF